MSPDRLSDRRHTLCLWETSLLWLYSTYFVWILHLMPTYRIVGLWCVGLTLWSVAAGITIRYAGIKWRIYTQTLIISLLSFLPTSLCELKDTFNRQISFCNLSLMKLSLLKFKILLHGGLIISVIGPTAFQVGMTWLDRPRRELTCGTKFGPKLVHHDQECFLKLKKEPN